MSTVTDTQIQVRLTQDLKEQASVLFEKMGMSLSEAVRTFFESSGCRTRNAIQSAYS